MQSPRRRRLSSHAPQFIIFTLFHGTMALAETLRYSVTAGDTLDFNGDGRSDRFRVAEDGLWQVSFSGDGEWSTINASMPYISVSRLRFGDFNGDASTDILLSVPGTVTQAAWKISWGGTTAWEVANAAIELSPKEPFLIGDFNGDHRADILKLRAGPEASTEWCVAFSDGHHSLVDWETIESSTDSFNAHDLRLLDLNGNSISDFFTLVTVNGRPTSTWRVALDAPSGWANRVSSRSVALEEMLFGDLNGDGSADIVSVFSDELPGRWYTSASASGVWDYLGGSSSSLIENMFLGDFDGDGVSDLCQINRNNNDASVSYGMTTTRADFREIHHGRLDLIATGNPRRNLSESERAARRHRVVLGDKLDFDGDGKGDLFHRNDKGNWLVCHGGAPWQTIHTGQTEIASTSDLLFGDFDGDEITDVFTTRPNDDGTTFQWLVSNKGTEPFRLLRADGPLGVHDLRTGDFSGNGRADLFTIGTHEGTPGRWLISVGGVETWTVYPDAPESSLENIQLGDFNGNGATDLFTIAEGEGRTLARLLRSRDSVGNHWRFHLLSPGKLPHPRFHGQRHQ